MLPGTSLVTPELLLRDVSREALRGAPQKAPTFPGTSVGKCVRHWKGILPEGSQLLGHTSRREIWGQKTNLAPKHLGRIFCGEFG